MGDLTNNFSRSEFACNCGCGFDTVDVETLEVLQDVCDHFAEVLFVSKVVAYVTSGCRCEAYNSFINGAQGSQHKKARAVDLQIDEVEPVEVYNYLNKKYPSKYGIGRYSTFTHIDTRSGTPARW